MKGIIYEALYDVWCESGEKPAECPEVQQAIDGIGQFFKADPVGENMIEQSINGAVCECERIAFIEGLRMGAGLVSGRVFYDDLPGVEVY